MVKFRVFLERISDKAQFQRDFDTVSAERAETLARTMCRIIREDYRVLSVEQVGSVWTK